MTAPSPPLPPLQFPSHPHPRTWFLTAASSALGIAVARAVLAHGDDTVLCVEPAELALVARARALANGHKTLFAGSNGLGAAPGGERADEFVRFVMEEVDVLEGWRARCRVVGLDGRSVIGTVEELAACPRTLTLIREQFETNFFSPVNIIKAALPAMREKRAGHIIVLTGISRSRSFAPCYGGYWALILSSSEPSGDARVGDILCVGVGAGGVL
ncbi:hypothetical protein MMC26_004884 [Xylographa opegraphella]|nr:hypothetical protein [Xylographa opegraphella]